MKILSPFFFEGRFFERQIDKYRTMVGDAFFDHFINGNQRPSEMRRKVIRSVAVVRFVQIRGFNENPIELISADKLYRSINLISCNKTFISSFV